MDSHVAGSKHPQPASLADPQRLKEREGTADKSPFRCRQGNPLGAKERRWFQTLRPMLFLKNWLYIQAIRTPRKIIRHKARPKKAGDVQHVIKCLYLASQGKQLRSLLPRCLENFSASCLVFLAALPASFLVISSPPPPQLCVLFFWRCVRSSRCARIMICMFTFSVWGCWNDVSWEGRGDWSKSENKVADMRGREETKTDRGNER